MDSDSRILQADYDERFLSEYLGSVKNDPGIAIIEMVANAWDAGAEHVNIQWPEIDDEHGEIIIEDDGKGMTREEFERIWPIASYDRTKYQNSTVTLSDGSERVVFGHNGVGRFGMFCFSNRYSVETWKDGKSNKYVIIIDKPYRIEWEGSNVCKGHGTRIGCIKGGILNFITPDNLIALVRSKFFDGRKFEVKVNGKTVNLSREDPLKGPDSYETKYGVVTITRYPSDFNNKGILFRVNKRPVGDPSWKPLGDIIDSRFKEFSFQLVVDVDFMQKHVMRDWSDFEKGDIYEQMMMEVIRVIRESLSDVFDSNRSEKKKAAIEANLPKIRGMSKSSQKKMGRIIDGILEENPKIKPKELKSVLAVIANCEMSESRYALMDKLASISPLDVDALNSILDDWSIRELKVVHDELNHRMDVVKELQQLVNNPQTDELHRLQPLFKDNLWMFGPEYDSCAFQSNRTITTILRDMFKVKDPSKDSKRPDIIMLPDSSLCAYCADKFDVNGEAEGFHKIVIVELKRGGFEIGYDEKSQATKYALEIINNGKVNADVTIMCYVLGSRVKTEIASDATEKNGHIVIRPLAYDLLLRKAELRLFDLIKKMEEVHPEVTVSGDEIIDNALSEVPTIMSFRSD